MEIFLSFYVLVDINVESLDTWLTKAVICFFFVAGESYLLAPIEELELVSAEITLWARNPFIEIGRTGAVPLFTFILKHEAGFLQHGTELVVRSGGTEAKEIGILGCLPSQFGQLSAGMTKSCIREHFLDALGRILALGATFLEQLSNLCVSTELEQRLLNLKSHLSRYNGEGCHGPLGEDWRRMQKRKQLSIVTAMQERKPNRIRNFKKVNEDTMERRK